MNISNLFFPYFDSLLPSTTSRHIAVAVSGGSDSLALCLLLNEWAKLHQIKLTAITVDHQIRPDSSNEAAQLHQWLSALEIHHEILTWHHSPLKSHIQESARDARYNLLIKYCKQHHIQHLCIGHHQGDQWETFFMRLSHSSGLKGLGGMSHHTIRNEINIYRPLLNSDPTLLKDYLLHRSQSWIEDPSNYMEKYERIRWRQQIPLLSGLGLSPTVITNVCEKLSDDDKALNWAAQNWMNLQCNFNNQLKFFTVPLTLKELPKALIKRIALSLASNVKGITLTTHDIRHNMDSFIQKLMTEPFRAFTFGGCYWMERQEKLYIVREWDKCPQLSITTENATYDNRFQLIDLPFGKTLEPVRKKYWPLIKSMIYPAPFPYQVFLSLPVIVEDAQITWQHLLI